MLSAGLGLRTEVRLVLFGLAVFLRVERFAGAAFLVLAGLVFFAGFLAMDPFELNPARHRGQGPWPIGRGARTTFFYVMEDSTFDSVLLCAFSYWIRGKVKLKERKEPFA